MANIYNSLSSAWTGLSRAVKDNPPLLFFIFVLLAIPLPYAYGGISMAVFVLSVLVTFRKRNFVWEPKLGLLVFLYLLMVLSLVWTEDVQASTRALSKELPFIALPLCFMAMKPFSDGQRQLVVKYYSYGVLGYILFYLAHAVVRFSASGNAAVFFYHELVSEDVNAIHVSAYVTVAIFYFFKKERKSVADVFILFLMGIFVLLLSSKNMIIVAALLVIFYELLFFKATTKIIWIAASLFLILGFTIVFADSIRDRFLVEFRSNQAEGTVAHVDNGGKVYNVSIKQAWEKEKFSQSDYFPGAAFRVYQFRVFNEIMARDHAWLTGYGLNATDAKIEEQGLLHGVFVGNKAHEGYQKKNFHNQYTQTFAELGVFGFLLLLWIVFVNLGRSFSTKDFVHISFAVLMISLFLTESFLARQRGIVFFTALYCLFNSRYPAQRTEKKPINA